jgi:hypothetical protein
VGINRSTSSSITLDRSGVAHPRQAGSPIKLPNRRASLTSIPSNLCSTGTMSLVDSPLVHLEVESAIPQCFLPKYKAAFR